MLWPHSKARELICSGQTGPLENIDLKGEGKKHLKRHFLYSQKTECHGENDEGVCVCNHVFIYLNPTLQIL